MVAWARHWKYQSGTIEEIEEALLNVNSLEFGDNSVMVLFRKESLSIQASDLDAAIRVRDFRESISSRGVLYRDYEGHNSLREMIFRVVGILLAHIINGESANNARGVNSQSALHPSPPVENGLLVANVEELGLLDYDEKIGGHFRSSGAAIEAIGAAISSFTDEMNYWRDKNAGSDPGDPATRTALQKLSEQMSSCAQKLDTQAPIASTEFEIGLSLIEQMLELQASDFDVQDAERYRSEILEALSLAEPNIILARDSMIGAIDAQQRLGRLTKEMNAAKRHLLSASDKVLLMYDQNLIRLRDKKNQLEGLRLKGRES